MKIIDIFILVLRNLLNLISQYTGGVVVMTVLVLAAYGYVRKYGAGRAIRSWLTALRRSGRFRYMFLLLLAISMLLYKTVLCCKYNGHPMGNVWGQWTLYNTKGVLNTAALENGILFVVIAYLCLVMNDLEKKLPFKNVMQALLASAVGIEMLQIFFRTGRFQLSDIAYSAAGIILGAVIYKIKKRVADRYDN